MLFVSRCCSLLLWLYVPSVLFVVVDVVNDVVVWCGCLLLMPLLLRLLMADVCCYCLVFMFFGVVGVGGVGVVVCCLLVTVTVRVDCCWCICSTLLLAVVTVVVGFVC